MTSNNGRLASVIHIRRANARDESPKVLVYYILLPQYSIHNRRYDLFEFAADSVLKIGSDDEPSASKTPLYTLQPLRSLPSCVANEEYPRGSGRPRI